VSTRDTFAILRSSGAANVRIAQALFPERLYARGRGLGQGAAHEPEKRLRSALTDAYRASCVRLSDALQTDLALSPKRLFVWGRGLGEGAAHGT
jgi:hypothetical protein